MNFTSNAVYQNSEINYRVSNFLKSLKISLLSTSKDDKFLNLDCYNGNMHVNEMEQIITMNNEIRFTNVSGDGYNLVFKEEFNLKYRIDNGYFLADYRVLNYFGYGENYQELRADFEEFIIVNTQI